MKYKIIWSYVTARQRKKIGILISPSVVFHRICLSRRNITKVMHEFNKTSHDVISELPKLHRVRVSSSLANSSMHCYAFCLTMCVLHEVISQGNKSMLCLVKHSHRLRLINEWMNYYITQLQRAITQSAKSWRIAGAKYAYKIIRVSDGSLKMIQCLASWTASDQEKKQRKLANFYVKFANFWEYAMWNLRISHKQHRVTTEMSHSFIDFKRMFSFNLSNIGGGIINYCRRNWTRSWTRRQKAPIHQKTLHQCSYSFHNNNNNKC